MGVIFVHKKTREKEFTADGYGAYLLRVMYNDFGILGSSLEPARVKRDQDADVTL